MGDQMAMIVGVACSLVALVLAWRAYRSAADEHEDASGKRRGELSAGARRAAGHGRVWTDARPRALREKT